MVAEATNGGCRCRGRRGRSRVDRCTVGDGDRRVWWGWRLVGVVSVVVTVGRHGTREADATALVGPEFEAEAGGVPARLWHTTASWRKHWPIETAVETHSAGRRSLIVEPTSDEPHPVDPVDGPREVHAHTSCVPASNLNVGSNRGHAQRTVG
jgi:hypothetical protein